jgi:hypothetical protein
VPGAGEVVAPLLFHGIRGPEHPGEASLPVGVLLGVPAHLLSLIAAVALAGYARLRRARA